MADAGAVKANGGRVALVTGASGGIGLELARLLAADGCDVVLVARSEERLRAAASELKGAYGVATQVVAQNLSDPGAAGRVKAAVDELGLKVDVLANNAGFGCDAPFVESDPARQRALMQVNVAAVVELCRAFAPGMVERGAGGILNVASMAGFMAGPFMSTYYASKAFVQTFTQGLHAELRLSGVHVTALCPGPVRTEFWNAADAGQTLLAHAAMGAPRVARAGLRALRWNKTLCVPGIVPKALVFATRLVPRSWMAYAAAALQLPKRKG
ncbi:SDR family NAD(P)-dependent oxidoreductase [Gordonibacter massiliensis (ex Traore et al. 2017)]|uniref:SDR family oxidoreductase n=1 Tax=Gordonibacter massiliensis (ex Traore et al. 2017) TaxID=1841863 RepID=A0A842JFX4_9ACTN|nr:SDR family oxidoreductase [Gordonibacter massiliensis (ex Traore et al. 2017)]MBC2890547.1 SDR family oxidoreductase [Gordonibacter massiliensis (ex Traore et al. 2017)]